MDPNIDLDMKEEPDPDDQPEEPKTDNHVSGAYAQVIGSLMYAALGLPPDVAFTVTKLAKFTKDPQPKHWTAVKHVFQYLKGTQDYSLTFGGDQKWKLEITVYCDADWGGGTGDRKLTSGYVVLIAGGAVSEDTSNSYPTITRLQHYISFSLPLSASCTFLHFCLVTCNTFMESPSTCSKTIYYRPKPFFLIPQGHSDFSTDFWSGLFLANIFALTASHRIRH